MNGDQVIRALKDRTDLEVSEAGVRAAVEAAPAGADVEAACKQVVDWFVSGQTRVPFAHPILTAAFREQQAVRKPKLDARQQALQDARDHLRLKQEWAAKHLPSLPDVYVISELFTLWPDPDPAEVRRRVEARFGESLAETRAA